MKIYRESEENIIISQSGDPLLTYLTSRIRELAKKYIPYGGRILDLGCGIGRTSLVLAQDGYAVTGVEVSQKAISIAKKNISKANFGGNTHFIVKDATQIAPKELGEEFGGIICSEVIEHIDDYEKLFVLSWRMLKKGGFLLLTAPHDQGQWSVLDNYAGHHRRFRSQQLRDVLGSTGFTVIELFTVGFPFMRILLWAYGLYIKVSGKTHNFRNYGKSVGYRFVYIPLVSLILRIDRFFDWIKKGTTIVIVARK